MKISRPKRVSSANASSEAREAIDTVGISTNSFMNEAYIAIMGQLSVTDNLNMSFVVVDVNVDVSGNLNRSVRFKTGLNSGRAVMILCGRVSKANPTGGVMVGFVEDSGVITLTNLTGLTADTDYQLTLLVIGS